MSPAVKAELDRVIAAAEYAVANPVGTVKRLTIRGYIRSGGYWYVEALEEDNPEPLTLDGAKLVQSVEEAKLRVRLNEPATADDPYGEAASPADNPARVHEVAISRKGVSVTVQTPDDETAQGHPVSPGENSPEEAA